MQHKTLNDEERADLDKPELYERALPLYRAAEAAYVAEPSVTTLALLRQAYRKLQHSLRKKGNSRNVGQVSMSRPGRVKRTDRPAQLDEEPPAAAVRALLPPA